MTEDPFWSDRFHFCALAAGFIAAAEGRLDESLYVREMAYSFYKEGAFRERATQTGPKEPQRPSARRGQKGVKDDETLCRKTDGGRL
jgi:hypothetical protein